MPPTPGDLARLARKARATKIETKPVAKEPYIERSLRRRLGPEVIQQLVERYKAGEYTTHLSREYGISKSGLLDLLVAEGVAFRKQPMTEEATKRAIQLYESGLSINEVVGRVGYSYGTIRRALHMNDVIMRPKGVARKHSERREEPPRAAEGEPKAISNKPGRTKRRNRQLTLEERQDIAARYMAGEDPQVIRKAHRISNHALCKVLRGAGLVKERAKRITSEEITRAAELYESGMTLEKVVDQVGYSAATIRNRLIERGVSMRTGRGPRSQVRGA